MSVCIALFAVYFVSNLLLGEMLPERFLLLMALTGHAVFLYVGFMYPELAICGSSGRVCTSWTAEQGCMGYGPPFDPTCTMLVSLTIFIGLCALLLAVYFGVGALIGRVVEIALKRKSQHR